MIRVVVAIMVILAMGGAAIADKVKFDADAIGSAPAGWTQAKTGKGEPKWTVEQDPTAPSKSKVIKQSGRASYPLLLKNGTSLKDGFIDVQFKALSASEDRAAGLVWRAKDADNYYVVRANALEDNVVLYKTVKGARSSLDIVGRKGGYGSRLRSRPSSGIASGSNSKAAALPAFSTGNSYSKSRMRPSTMLAWLDYGPRPTA
jgi:hypothetical protein